VGLAVQDSADAIPVDWPEGASVAYYVSANGLAWVQPVHALTGGTLCTERPLTYESMVAAGLRDHARLFEPGSKVSLGLAPRSLRPQLRRRPRRLMLADIARELSPDLIVTTADRAHHLRRDLLGLMAQGGRSYRHIRQAQIFHSVSSKNLKYSPHMAAYDLLLLTGPEMRDRFVRLGVLEKVRWTMVGVPKTDAIVRGEMRREEVLADLGLELSARTVLYAPTHGTMSSFPEHGLDICEAVPGEHNLIVKLHGLLAMAARDGEVKGYERTKGAVAERERAAFIEEERDVLPLMAASDLLITDYSSVAQEFLVFDRPLVFFDHLAGGGVQAAKTRRRGEWESIHACGTVVTEARALGAVVERLLDSPEEKGEQRRAMRDYVFYKLDGRAAQRAATALAELCRAC